VATSFPGRPGPRGLGGFAGTSAPPPVDLLLVLAAVFVTFSMQFFETTAVVPALLRLTPAVLRGFVWQLVTYPFVGTGGASIWFLLELLILFWFGRDVWWRLSRRRFWRLILSPRWRPRVAVATHALMVLAGAGRRRLHHHTGPPMLITTRSPLRDPVRQATILLFVVPLKPAGSSGSWPPSSSTCCHTRTSRASSASA
jgi:hypothetical protein